LLLSTFSPHWLTHQLRSRRDPHCFVLLSPLASTANSTRRNSLQELVSVLSKLVLSEVNKVATLVGWIQRRWLTLYGRVECVCCMWYVVCGVCVCVCVGVHFLLRVLAVTSSDLGVFAGKLPHVLRCSPLRNHVICMDFTRQMQRTPPTHTHTNSHARVTTRSEQRTNSVSF
jgi:hypothetical protein